MYKDYLASSLKSIIFISIFDIKIDLWRRFWPFHSSILPRNP